MRPILLLALLSLVPACRRSDSAIIARAPYFDAARDTGFAGVQARGEHAMGVDQYTSTHVFEPLPDGGRITLERDEADSLGVRQIRQHMEHIAEAFGAGDFSLPGFVHAKDVPGTVIMTARRKAIAYTVEFVPRGATVRLLTADPAAVRAIHDFLAFQRQEHHASAHPGA